jgi:hypothetical protein
MNERSFNVNRELATLLNGVRVSFHHDQHLRIIDIARSPCRALFSSSPSSLDLAQAF